MNMDYILIIGIVLILLILLVLIRTVRDYGTAIRSMQSKLFHSGCPQPQQTQNHAAASAAGTPVPAAEPGISEEVVAAISAAVYCMYPGAAVKFIRRSSSTNAQSAWKMAGLLESTRPF